MARKMVWLLVLVLVLSMAACAPPPEEPEEEEEVAEPDEVVLTLATTTSTEDSGLLDDLLPVFEEETGYEVDVIAVGTGQALEIGRRGDADILLVHAPELEEEFVDEGYGTERYPVMYNDFILLGPPEDPAQLGEAAETPEAMQALVDAGEAGEAEFASRGDESGTHTKELSLWEGVQDDVEEMEWYNSLGQGMGDTLVAANEMGAYTLADRGTYLAMEEQLANLEIVFEDSPELHNPYGIIPVNPEEFPNVHYDAAQELVDFFIRDDIQERISEFGVEEFGQPLFFPDAA